MLQFSYFSSPIISIIQLKQQPLSQAEIYQKLMRYCAYQDRCSADIAQKIRLWGLGNDVLKGALEFLKDEGFIDDLRYAKSFVRGKFRSNKWGTAKIKEGLYAKKIPKALIVEALTELETEDYQGQLKEVLLKKDRLLKEDDPFKREQKLALYAQSKGYELNLIWKILKEIKQDTE